MAASVAQKTSVVGTNVASITSPSLTTTTGNTVHGSFVFYQSIASFSSFVEDTGSPGNSYTLIDTQLGGGTAISEMRHYYSANITGGGTTWKLTLSANTYPSMAILELAGVASAPLDQQGKTAITFSTTYAVSTSGATTQADEIVVSTVGGNDCAGTPFVFTPDGAYTAQENLGDAITYTPFLCQTRVIAATGTQTCTSTANFNASLPLIISTFKASGGGGGAFVPIIGRGPGMALAGPGGLAA